MDHRALRLVALTAATPVAAVGRRFGVSLAPSEARPPLAALRAA